MRSFALNFSIATQHPDYVCRVTSDEGDIGRGHLSRFQDVDTKAPTILTTSQLLTTGVDTPTCKNVMLVSESRKDFFARYGPEARQMLEELRGKYAEHGNAQFVLPDVLRVPPLTEHGTVLQISAAFGGADNLRAAVTELQNLLYAA